MKHEPETIPLLGDFIIRGNVMRRVGNPATFDSAVQLQGLANAVVDDNIVDVLEGGSGVATQGIAHTGAGHFTVFNNKTSAGSLVRGYNVTTSLHDPELTTEVENLWMSL